MRRFRLLAIAGRGGAAASVALFLACGGKLGELGVADDAAPAAHDVLVATSNDINDAAAEVAPIRADMPTILPPSGSSCAGQCVVMRSDSFGSMPTATSVCPGTSSDLTEAIYFLRDGGS